MIWSPNVAIGYPFSGGGQAYPTLATDPINFRAMDTNNDGWITYLDDGYLPYYPGNFYC